MTRRPTRNVTDIRRVAGVPHHDAWVHFSCVACGRPNLLRIGKQLLTAADAYETAEWECSSCGYVHENGARLPFQNWPRKAVRQASPATARFWQAFFRSATERPASYWKQCNVCGRVLPFSAFSRHKGWGPLERQMECRSCKGAINAILNPKRTKEQLHEGAVRRRAADLLLEGQNQRIVFEDLFRRFGSRCFKSGQGLDIRDRSCWRVDHILPSRYLYPLTPRNAALLSKEANESKRDQWPSQFYTNSELKRLAKITGADLALLSSPTPVLNPHIDVNACVERALQVRERSDLHKRILKLRQFLLRVGLADRITNQNRKILGLE